MSRYVIELRPDCKVVQQICAIDKGINIGSRSIGLLDELTDEYVKKNFKDLLEGEYQRGLDDAWEAAKKIANMWTRIGNNELLAIFGITERIGHSTIRALFEKQTANEAMLELEAHEKKQRADDKIKVRDEVVWTEDENVVIVVTSVYTADDMEWCDGVCKDGKVYSILMKNARKTGRHFDIQKILEEMRND